MRFTQTVGFRTKKVDELRRMSEDYRQDQGPAAPGFLGARILKDRDREDTYLIVADFESYERAMENSARPETDAMARRMAELVEGEIVYTNYDVIDE